MKKNEPSYSILLFDNDEVGQMASKLDEILESDKTPKSLEQLILEAGGTAPEKPKDK